MKAVIQLSGYRLFYVFWEHFGTFWTNHYFCPRHSWEPWGFFVSMPEAHSWTRRPWEIPPSGVLTWQNISICSAKKKVENWAFSSSWDYPFIYPAGWSTMHSIWLIQRWVTWKFRTILQQRRVQFNELSHLWSLRLDSFLFTQMPTFQDRHLLIRGTGRPWWLRCLQYCDASHLQHQT